jgi:hypothetical protein
VDPRSIITAELANRIAPEIKSKQRTIAITV